MIIWRPVMERLVTLEAVIDGRVDMEHLAKLNALIDARNYQQRSVDEE